MKLTNRAKLVMGGILCLFSVSSFADTGWCTATSGTNNFSFDFIKNFTNPNDNSSDMNFIRTYQWDLNKFYKAKCDCISGGQLYVRAQVPLGAETRSVDKLKYYSLNKYLEVASEIFIGGGRGAYIATPFTQDSNEQYDMCSATALDYATGSKGYVSLYFTRPFVGQVAIPTTKILDLYASRISGSFGPIPISSVYMSGSVTVPQSCNINAGQVINVDFGNIVASKIKTKGEIPEGMIPKLIDMTVACNNISDGVKISLSINGTASSDDPTALATSNNDIAVRILDATGTPVEPNNGLLPVIMNYAAQTGTSSMSLAPINVTGHEPAVGEFNAVATIKAEMQ